MSTTTETRRLHPLYAVAAGSVILVSLLGAAAITGILPSSNSTPAPATSQLAQVNPTMNPTMAPNGMANGLAPNPTMTPNGTPNMVPTMAPNGTSPNTGIVPPHLQSKPQHNTTHHAQNNSAKPVATVAAREICATCGTISSVQAIAHEAPQTSGVGAVAGAVLGGVLGNQVGGGNGKKIATVAGAIGGGLAGNAIEKKTRTSTTWQVKVKMEDGSTRSVNFETEPNWHAGDAVRVENGAIVARG